jgi:outer membrane protein assembly factor BamB
LDPLEADDPRVIGDFRLQARLGAGGMGRVYLGFSPAGRAVAVKVIHPHLARDPSFASRFQREVAAAQAVNAVYAAPVVAAGPNDTPPWLATAFVPAPPLQDVVATAGPLPEEAVWKLAAGLAEGLRAVHASGLVHRDLKPGNVLLAADGPRLIDFGIAQVVDGTRLTTTGGVLGTPSYMSPEQARGDSVGPPSDIFSLGGVVHFAATGQPPFGSGIPAALLYKIVFGEPDLDGLPPQLRSLVAACLDKNPAARPTPAQLATALMPAMPNQFTPSRLAFWPEPVERFINDYRARLDQGSPQAPQAPGTWPPAPSAGGWQPAGEPTAGRMPGDMPAPPLLGATTVRQRQAGGRHARETLPVAGMNRRRALAALAGAATAGIGIAGWEVAAHAGPGKPKVAAFQLPKVAAGKVAWRFNANANVSSVVEAGKTVYVATTKNAVYALNAATGRQLWKSTTTSMINDSIMLAGSSLVISGSNGPYGLAAANGKPRWSVHSDVGSYPLLGAGGVAYVSFAAKSDVNSGVTALDPATGTILWISEFGENDGIAGTVAVAKGVVYTTSDAGKVFALSASNGTVRRQAGGFGKFGYGAIAVINGAVYAGLDDKQGTVVAVDMTSGQTLWRRSLGPSLFPPYVAAAGGVLYAGTMDGGLAGAQVGTLYALHVKTGKQLWSMPVNGGVNEGPIVANGVIYTGSGNLDKNLDNGALQAWQPATGKKLWSYAPRDSQGGLSGVSGSRVYYNANGYLYSLGA